MPAKKHKPEEIIGKLREVEIMLGQGGTTAEAWAEATAVEVVGSVVAPGADDATGSASRSGGEAHADAQSSAAAVRAPRAASTDLASLALTRALTMGEA